MTDVPRTPSLAETIQMLVDAKLFDLHTNIPAKIIDYDYANNLATVQPCLKRKYKGEDNPVNLPTISNVPVAFPRMGDAWVRLPVNTGDEGKLSFCERSIDKWLDQGGFVDPDDARKFSLSDAVFEPGLTSLPNKMVSIGDEKSLQIQYKDSFFEIKDDGKFKMAQDGGEELVALMKEFSEIFRDAKVDTAAGPSPISGSTQTIINAFILRLEAFGDL